ncbi:histidine phosphatase family protein [Pseudodesulfovibrio indicus]|uniref:histidine phosphatase family protein n=1 Tax=Pseudodesulfovibrio indicus TaxID=1716143 RepID=UPI00292DF21F|nr:histidine phosphatase family protein [Pseudodesulfovibrio indicus]
MIILLRHAVTDVAPGTCIGRTPTRLSPQGEAQARELAGSFAEVGVVRICSSPATRAMDTVSPLAERLGLPVETWPALDEIDMGAWDGLPFETIRRDHPDGYARRGREFASFHAPGGESFEEVAERAMGAMRRLAGGAMPVLAATHAGVIRAVLCRVTGHPLGDLFHFRPGHCRCTVLGFVAGGFGVLAPSVSPAEAAALVRG